MRRQWSDAAALPLRLVLGFGFMYHGFPKVFTTEGHATLVSMLQQFPAPEALAWAVGILEFFGGALLILGAFTRTVSALCGLEMAAALFMVHLPNGFNFIHIVGMTESGPVFGMPGYEVNLLYIAGLAALVIGGAGALSIDRMRSGNAIVGREAMPPGGSQVPDRGWTGAPDREVVGAGVRDA
jgi:putative oxidoreductase